MSVIRDTLAQDLFQAIQAKKVSSQPVSFQKNQHAMNQDQATIDADRQTAQKILRCVEYLLMDQAMKPGQTMPPTVTDTEISAFIRTARSKNQTIDLNALKKEMVKLNEANFQRNKTAYEPLFNTARKKAEEDAMNSYNGGKKRINQVLAMQDAALNPQPIVGSVTLDDVIDATLRQRVTP